MDTEKHDEAQRQKGGDRTRRKPVLENAIRWADAPVRERPGQRARPASEELPTRSPVQGVAESRAGGTTPAVATSVAQVERVMPAVVHDHFVQVGQQYFFADGTRAFTDRGVKLSTPSENTQVISDLVAIAQARGWQRVTVSGSERFRKEAWTAAREAGLEVKGYRASAQDEARVVRRLARESRASSTDAAVEGERKLSGQHEVREPRPQTPRQHRGRLIDHGVATYKHDPHEPVSYFVKIETSRGEQEIWGVDLERAFRESLSRPQIGDEIVLRAVKREPVTVKTRGRSGEPEVPRDIATHRNRWIAEKKEFLEGREKAAEVLRDPSVAAARGSRDHPELLGAYLQVNAAELAAKKFRDPQDRERFVSMVRAALADSVARGEALPAVRVRQAEVERRNDERDGTAVRGAQERGGRGRER